MYITKKILFKPYILFQDEKKRIEDLGGCVVWFGAWRVNGTLSVSRAIGDASHKPYVRCGLTCVLTPLVSFLSV